MLGVTGPVLWVETTFGTPIFGYVDFWLRVSTSYFGVPGSLGTPHFAFDVPWVRDLVFWVPGTCGTP